MSIISAIIMVLSIPALGLALMCWALMPAMKAATQKRLEQRERDLAAEQAYLRLFEGKVSGAVRSAMRQAVEDYSQESGLEPEEQGTAIWGRAQPPRQPRPRRDTVKMTAPPVMDCN